MNWSAEVLVVREALRARNDRQGREALASLDRLTMHYWRMRRGGAAQREDLALGPTRPKEQR